MAKGTVILLIILVFAASLLVGINAGKKIERTQIEQSPQQNAYNVPTLPPVPNIPTTTLIPSTSPTPIPSPTTKPEVNVSYTSATCGISFSYPGTYIKQQTTNNQSFIAKDENDKNAIIAVACETTIPRPPVSSENIEALTVAAVAATLYHDKNADGSPRDEVIVKHPNKNMEIIIVGYGPVFQQMLTSFKFL